jgi:hypothetical protein
MLDLRQQPHPHRMSGQAPPSISGRKHRAPRGGGQSGTPGASAMPTSPKDHRVSHHPVRAALQEIRQLFSEAVGCALALPVPRWLRPPERHEPPLLHALCDTREQPQLAAKPGTRGPKRPTSTSSPNAQPGAALLARRCFMPEVAEVLAFEPCDQAQLEADSPVRYGRCLRSVRGCGRPAPRQASVRRCVAGD